MCVEMLMDGARHTVAQANIDAKRITTASGNKKRAAESSLETFSQSLSNQRKMEAAGQQANGIEENLARNLDYAASGSLEQRVAAAEELGSSAMEAAAAGVGGSGIDAYNDTLRLREAMVEEQGDRAVASQTIAAGQDRGNAIGNGVASMSSNAFDANLDFSQFVDDHKMSGLTKIVGTAAMAAATYFGGPQAGQAVSDVVMARQKAQNGDFAGSARSFGNALNEGKAGIDTYRAGADGTRSGEAWGKSLFRPRPSLNTDDLNSYISGAFSGVHLKL